MKHSIVSRVIDWLGSLLDLRAPIVSLPRHDCHFLLLDVKGVPPRAQTSSVRLQLLQLTGMSALGFAFTVQEQKAQVWYWDESVSREALNVSATDRGVAPWPESVLRETPEDGLHLVALKQGFEALHVKNAQIGKTRWFPQVPAPGVWGSFARDAGFPADTPVPGPLPLPRLLAPPKGWKLHSSLLKPISYQAWLAAAVLALVGGVLVSAVTYQAKLSWALAEEEEVIAKISTENAKTIALQKQIEDLAAYLSISQKAQARVIQLELLAILANSGLTDAEGKTSLLEWEYRNNQLRLLFVVPAEGFELTEFLGKLEGLPFFKEIHLQPDSPPRTVGVQGTLVASLPKLPAPPVNASASDNPQAEESVQKQP